MSNPSQVQLDPTFTTNCITASLASYSDYLHDPYASPPGFRMVHRFTGWDALFRRTGDEERFGLIFQSLKDHDVFLVAFRGTASILDAYEDAWFDDAVFEPFDAKGFHDDVVVAEGFWSVYSGLGPNMHASMRQQVFAYLDAATPREVLVTGHSLGGALANLFMLDYAVSRPHVTTRATTLASPRTGKAAWKKAFDDAAALAKRTFRVANYYDWVPSLPPRDIVGYEHVGQSFLVAFYLEDALETDVLSRHSLLNYQTVLINALSLKPQVWVGTFRDAVREPWFPFHTMRSIVPPEGQAPPEWVSIWRDLRREHLPK